MNCPICVESFTNFKRKKVECPYCPFNSCKECTQRYLTTTTNAPHCMSCKKEWDDNICCQLLGNFMTSKYRKHRKQLMFEIEKSQIPSTMPFVEQYTSVSKYKKEINKLSQDEEKAISLLNKIRKEKNEKKKLIDNIEKGIFGKEKGEERKAFVVPCPINDCKGYLSSQWKCGACGIHVCNECREVKGETKDAEHTCDQSKVETIKLLKKETKPCPGCGTNIFKISGCDQMWCTNCHVPFSWKSGKKINGVIHNPHYYQYAKENGLNARNPGQGGHCGGLITPPMLIRLLNDSCPLYHFCTVLQKTPFNKYRIWEREQIESISVLRTKMNREFPSCMNVFLILKKFIHLHQCISHFLHVELNHLRTFCQQQKDNKLMRIRYISGEVEEKTFMTNLLRRDNKWRKKNAILQIYELAGTILTESFISIERDLSLSNMIKNINACESARIYCNKELVKIGQVYKQSVNCIDRSYTSFSYSHCGKSSDKLKEDLFKEWNVNFKFLDKTKIKNFIIYLCSLSKVYVGPRRRYYQANPTLPTVNHYMKKNYYKNDMELFEFKGL